MAIYNAGYLSPIRKKLGNAVGRKWRTLDILAVYQPFVRNPRTESQQLVRTRFGKLAKIAMMLFTGISKGLEVICKGTKVPQRSMFIKLNWNHIHADVPGSATVDWEDLVIAQGALALPTIGALTAPSANTIKLVLNDAAQGDPTVIDAADEVYMVLANPNKNMGLISTSVIRTEDEIEMTVPANWVGDRLHAYVFAVGKGTQDMDKVSNSVYGGSVTVV